MSQYPCQKGAEFAGADSEEDDNVGIRPTGRGQPRGARGAEDSGAEFDSEDDGEDLVETNEDRQFMTAYKNWVRKENTRLRSHA